LAARKPAFIVSFLAIGTAQLVELVAALQIHAMALSVVKADGLHMLEASQRRRSAGSGVLPAERRTRARA